MNQADLSQPKTPEEKLNIMAGDASQLGQDVGFMSPGTTRKRGRPQGSKSKDQKVGPTPGGVSQNAGPGAHGNPLPGANFDPIAELMPLTNGLASFYSNMLVQVAEDERAKLTEEKHKIVAHTSAVCLNQYLPGVLGKHAPLIVLAVTVAETSLCAMRFRKENLIKLREEQKLKKQGMTNGQAGPQSVAPEPSPFQ